MMNIEDYVKRQVTVFQANERREKLQGDRERRPGRGQEGSLFYGPYLLISREKGAGASTVARLLGPRLGWQVFDSEIVDAIAQKARVRRQLIESLDEREQATIEEAIGQLLNPQQVGTSDYLGYLKQVVLTLGHQGDVVIVGRAAQFILPSPFGLRVRLVAPIEARVRRIAEQARLSLEAARAEVERTDREREKLARHHFGHHVADPLNHDLIINTAAISPEAVAEVVLTALQQKLRLQLKVK